MLLKFKLVKSSIVKYFTNLKIAEKGRPGWFPNPVPVIPVTSDDLRLFRSMHWRQIESQLVSYPVRVSPGSVCFFFFLNWLLPSVSAWGELGQDAAWCPRLCLQSALPNAWAWPQIWTWRCLWPFFGWPCVWAPSSTRSWLQPLVEASLRDGRAGQGLTEQSCGLGSAQTCFLHWPVQEPKPYR